MERFLPLIYIVGWFGAIFSGSYLINWLLIRSIIRRYYRYFVAPGVIIHELSHALGCLITRSPIVEINFWKPSGGHVKHLQPNDPFRRLINDPIIALAPIWGTFCFIGLISYLLLPDLTRLAYFIDISIPRNLFTFLDPTRWQTWLWLYLVTSAVATMAPSKTDIHYALSSLIVLAFSLFALVFIPGFSNWLISGLQVLQPFVIFSFIVITVGIVIAFLLALPNRTKHFIPKNQLE